ncbi:hypothetical protein HBI73_034470 [Parastagonospora nodorum]|nr:hypothetical protein HBI73_034470 [Parastagonospora nodorum]KAH5479652.1 hypothetical protein HBI28_043310 [Parastagonospora nodorum]KAH5642766.1 hypothetical protein HBI22_051720 [Parastagonospora nodorum]KAH5670834.1 hypothetical protein HBI21_183580 [Parastagonospora nodorum]KAH6131059.1 hypothetical protein HBI64_100120 [Parastagonospora nodorum]
MSSQRQAVDIEMSEAGSDYPLFDESIVAIQHNILDEHLHVFRHVDASSLLDELRNSIVRDSTRDRRIAAPSRKLALFVQTFAPYFDVLGICTKVRPEWPGCFWGLVHLLYQVINSNVLFYEKVADMFEAMASILPPYQQIYTICKQRLHGAQIDAEDERLAMLMSYAFSDLVNLCLDIYRIFFRSVESSGSRHLTNIFTTSTQWRPLDSRFAQLEVKLTHHRRWLERETESHIQDFAVVEHRRQKYLRSIHRQDGDVHATGELLERRMAKRLRRVELVCDWISNGVQNQRTDPSARRTEHRGSCNWFLDLEKYRKWKNRYIESLANNTNALQDNWHDRVLFVQAEAGFGKTVVADAVVDDLGAEAEDLESSNAPPSTACFHVKVTHPSSVHPGQIFREITLQLLYNHRHSHATLDAVCLLLRKTSFQQTATAKDILDLLLVLLRQHPTFVIVDGLERCIDERGFLSSLAQLCQKTDVRVIIFSRPAIGIPLEYQKWASDAPHIVPLNSQHTAKSKELYMSQQLAQMADQGYFGIDMDREILPHVARQSNGTFLWATLLLNYVQSPALSPDERQSILLDAHLLEGLEALYSSIFETLRNQPAHEKLLVADVIRWLTFPVHRLCTSALRMALSVSIDISEYHDTFPTELLEILPRITCGLIEVSDGGLSFVHPSVREYLQAPASQGSEFSLCDESSVHAHLAARCLSYLAHDIPQRPLGGLSPYIQPMMPTNSAASYRTTKSGDSGYKSISSSDSEHALPQPAMQSEHTNASTASIRTVPFDTNLPFLRYASLCWPIHLSRALAPTNTHPYVIPCPGPFEALPYIPTLSAFLSSRLSVTAWVEASFRYSLPPTLTRLVGPLADLRGELSPATIEGAELRLVVSELNVLGEKLMELKRGYATSLRENPSLIWRIGDAVGEGYWPVWDASVGMPR